MEKFHQVDFGRCPRAFCHGQAVLPVGQSDVPRTFTVKIFCPSCRDIFHPRLSRHAPIDGAFFGTTFPHMLLQTYPEYMPAATTTKYVPRIFGFKIHSTAHEASLRAKQEAKLYRKQAMVAQQRR
jgi:casein kinase II subunit beta